MSRIFKRNIDATGRVLRGLFALGLFLAAVLVWPHLSWAAVILGLCGGFVLFEALRGWCVMRACGIKTKY
jgi:hypothetical protein